MASKKEREGFYTHQERAQDEYITHLQECDHRGDEILNERDIVIEIDCLEENFQIKMLDNGMVKIKWEMPCQWIGCHWHLYYCRLVADPHFEEPFDIAKDGRDRPGCC